MRQRIPFGVLFYVRQQGLLSCCWGAGPRDDPAGFLAGLEKPIILDEVQRALELFLAIKADVDRHRTFELVGQYPVQIVNWHDRRRAACEVARVS